MSKKKLRTVWIVSCLFAVLVLSSTFVFKNAGSTPFQFLHGSKVVAWKASEPSSHSTGADYCQRIFELDKEMHLVIKEVRLELPESDGWIEIDYPLEGDPEEFSFTRGDEFIVIMPHGANPNGTAVMYVRNATRMEMNAAQVFYIIPDRYRQWQ